MSRNVHQESSVRDPVSDDETTSIFCGRSRFSCKPRFRLQLFGRKNVNLVLVYNLVVVTALLFIFFPDTNRLQTHGHYLFNVMFGIAVCTFPLTGCLADTCLSRHRVVRYSMRFIWGMVVVFCAVSIIFYAQGICGIGHKEEDSHFCSGVKLTLAFLTVVGLGGFLTNIMQFGMDQLHDASSSEIAAFIMWHGWTWALGGLIVSLSQVCFCGLSRLVGKLLLVLLFSCALCLDFLLGHWLVKEPATQNPCKLFFGIVKYACQNKYPRQRSAFTYWENKRYSRIDLAKDKYGGPFTTEQVEDVKTTFRMLVLIVLASLLVGLWLTVNFYDYYALAHLDGGDISSGGGDPTSGDCTAASVANCLKVLTLRYFAFLVMFAYVPLHEFVVYPLFWKCILQVRSYWKFTFALACLTLYYVALMITEAVGHHYLPAEEKANFTCFLTASTSSTLLPVSYKWFYLPQVLNGLGRFYLGYSGLEFISSQAPYAMKGLLFGLLYLLVGLATLLCSLLLLPMARTVSAWKPVTHGCGVWFYLCVVLVFLLSVILSFLCFSKYKLRRRDEDVHNRHIFAIDYYSRYTHSTELSHNN